MELDVFNKLDKELTKKDFYSEYNSASKILFYLSFVGNIFSIMFAYFFMYGILSSTVLKPTPNTVLLINIITFVILIGSEVTKRFVFDKFSKSVIKDRFTFKLPDSKILGFISLMLVSLSFYLSLNGAKVYSSKDDQIKENTEVVIDTYADSVKNVYMEKIHVYENDIRSLTERNLDNSTKIDDLTDKMNDLSIDTWQERVEKKNLKSEINNIRKDKDANISLIEKNEVKIKELKTELEAEITKYSDKVADKADKLIDENSSNPVRFLFFSILIEFIILLGIYFINYHKIRSHREQREKNSKNPEYKKYILYSNIIDIIYMNDGKIGDKLPVKNDLLKMLKIKGIMATEKELDEMLKMITHLGVVMRRGPKRSIIVEHSVAKDIIKKQFPNI